LGIEKPLGGDISNEIKMPPKAAALLGLEDKAVREESIKRGPVQPTADERAHGLGQGGPRENAGSSRVPESAHGTLYEAQHKLLAAMEDAGTAEKARVVDLADLSANLREVVGEMEKLPAHSANEAVAAGAVATTCERAMAHVGVERELDERSAAIALAVAEARAAMEVEKEDALAQARAAADVERMAAVWTAKEEARREQEEVVAELKAEIALQRDWQTTATVAKRYFCFYRRSSQHMAVSRLITGASSPGGRRDGVRYLNDLPASERTEPQTPQTPRGGKSYRCVSQQTSLRNSALESASKVPAIGPLWRAHMRRSLMRTLWCA
jgi:hypothetical protein